MPMQISGSVVNIRNTKLSDGASNFVAQGQQGELLASEIHGQFWTGNVRGSVFWAGTAAAGTVIPVSTATASTFGIVNPIGSGVNVELIGYDSSLTTTVAVVGGILLGVNLNLNVMPTGVTKLIAVGGIGGNGGNIAFVYSVATVVASVAPFYNLGAYGAVTNGGLGLISYQFNGKVMLPPGSLAHVVSFAAQTAASTQSLAWAEYPA